VLGFLPSADIEDSSSSVALPVYAAVSPAGPPHVLAVPTLQVERGLGAAWHLQQIEVLNKKTGQLALFRYSDWLKGDKTTVTIPESSSDAAKQAAPGKVSCTGLLGTCCGSQEAAARPFRHRGPQVRRAS
jgi:hypothetical protein